MFHEYHGCEVHFEPTDDKQSVDGYRSEVRRDTAIRGPFHSIGDAIAEAKTWDQEAPAEENPAQIVLPIPREVPESESN